MTDANPANAYLRTKVLSASPEELRLMLLDGAVRFASQAKDGLERKDYEASYAGFTQCRAIVLELINSIKPEHAPELADRVRAVYSFLYTELVEASINREPARVGKCIELLTYERETWALLMDQIAAERRGEVPPASAQNQPLPAPPPGYPASQPAHGPAGSPMKSLSIQA